MSQRFATRRAHKYGARKTEVDGIVFDSKREATRYQELRLLEKAGKIWELELQPKFELLVPSTSGYLARAIKARIRGGCFKIGTYTADFKYRDAETVPYVIEDVKGVKTTAYRLKKRHVEAQYGIQIREV